MDQTITVEDFLRDLDEVVRIYIDAGWPPTPKTMKTLQAKAHLLVPKRAEIPAVTELDE